MKNQFRPILYINTVNVVGQQLIPVNFSVDTLPVEVSYSAIGMEQWKWFLELEMSFKVHQSWGTTETELEQVKVQQSVAFFIVQSMFLETDRYLLYVTFVISVLHLIFDMLTFKNDISFWRKTTNFQGLSLRSIQLNAISHFVVFLYTIAT